MANLLRVSLNGTMPGGEVFSVNPVYGFTAPLAVSSDECAQAAAAIDAVTIPATILAMIPSSMAWSGCRVEARTYDGTLENVAEHTRSSAANGTGSGAHPPQTSMVLSLRTVDSTARGKGRLYFPAISATTSNSTLRFTSTQVNDFLTGANAWLASIRTAIRGVGGMTTAALAVWSRTALTHKVVIQVRAGDVPDVQRRRRDNYVETYTSATVSAL